jgi:hypothetical protein
MSPPPTTNTTPPVATVSSSAPALTNTSPIPFMVTFSEDVTGFTAAGLAIGNGTVSNFSAIDGHTFTFSVTPSAQGAVSASVAAGAARDAAGNMNAVSNTVSLTFDSVAPSVTINPLTTNSTTPTITGTVADSTATVRVTVNSQTYTATVSGNTWSAAVTAPLTQGSYSVSAMATDPAGNSAAALPATLVVDLTAPAVTFGASPPGPTNASPVTVTITFSEDVTGFTAAGVTVDNGTFTFGTTDARHYTVTVTPTADGPVTVTVLAGAATDAAGNANPVGSFTFVYDGTDPTVTLDDSATGAVTGTATDAATSVQSVLVSVFDSDTGKYLSETGFDSDDPVFLPATDTGTAFATWSLDVSTPGTYDVTAKATDAAGNVATAFGSFTVL